MYKRIATLLLLLAGCMASYGAALDVEQFPRRFPKELFEEIERPDTVILPAHLWEEMWVIRVNMDGATEYFSLPPEGVKASLDLMVKEVRRIYKDVRITFSWEPLDEGSKPLRADTNYIDFNRRNGFNIGRVAMIDIGNQQIDHIVGNSVGAWFYGIALELSDPAYGPVTYAMKLQAAANVVAHEIGHGLGLWHINSHDQRHLMNSLPGPHLIAKAGFCEPYLLYLKTMLPKE